MSGFRQGHSHSKKLSNEQVWEIKDKYFNRGYTQAALCREYGVVRETIGRIVRGESRQNVGKPEAPKEDPMAVFNRLMVLQEGLRQAKETPEEKINKQMQDELNKLGDSDEKA